jgi:hypothetical protein
MHFDKFVYLDEIAELAITEQSPARIRLRISVANQQRSRITVQWGDATEERPPWADSSLEVLQISAIAENANLEHLVGRRGRLAFVMKPVDAAAMFPAATQWLGFQRVAALAATTHLVGMVCPGLHSIYSELSVRTCTESSVSDLLSFRVVEADARFRSVQLEVSGGGLAGLIESAARLPPVLQATMESLTGLVQRFEFSGHLALVVGGSRGLGELTAKLIASGGGRVAVTWHSGKEDAENVAREIRSVGGSCETLHYDARRPAAEQLSMLPETPTHLYYFATPTIFRPQESTFVSERFREFLAYYVEGFWDLMKVMGSRQPQLSAFYPSSVFVAERPEGMTEYSMAKAAGELLCAELNRSHAPLRVTVNRLPRLPTDQTASVVAVQVASPVDTMLPIVREVQSWPPALHNFRGMTNAGHVPW